MGPAICWAEQWAVAEIEMIFVPPAQAKCQPALCGRRLTPGLVLTLLAWLLGAKVSGRRPVSLNLKRPVIPTAVKVYPRYQLQMHGYGALTRNRHTPRSPCRHLLLTRMAQPWSCCSPAAGLHAQQPLAAISQLLPHAPLPHSEPPELPAPHSDHSAHTASGQAQARHARTWSHGQLRAAVWLVQASLHADLGQAWMHDISAVSHEAPVLAVLSACPPVPVAPQASELQSS